MSVIVLASDLLGNELYRTVLLVAGLIVFVWLFKNVIMRAITGKHETEPDPEAVYGTAFQDAATEKGGAGDVHGKVEPGDPGKPAGG